MYNKIVFKTEAIAHILFVYMYILYCVLFLSFQFNILVVKNYLLLQ